MRRLVTIGLIAMLALVLAACGGGEGGNNGENGAAALSFEANDQFRFVPESATVTAGAEVEVELRNVGTLEHSWVVVDAGADLNTVTDADAIGGTVIGPVAGGSTVTAGFSAPAAGTYRYVCTVPGHAAAGMVGTLTVQ